MTASQRAKELGCKSLAQVARESGQSKETLQSWRAIRPYVFDAVCMRVAGESDKGQPHD